MKQTIFAHKCLSLNYSSQWVKQKFGTGCFTGPINA